MDTLEMNSKSNDANNIQNRTVTIGGDPKELAAWMNNKVIIHRWTRVISGPKGLRADIGSLKRFTTSNIQLAKKFSAPQSLV